MSKENYTGLVDIIGHPKPKELGVARRFLTCFDGHADGKKTKNRAVALFDLIRKQPQTTYEQALKKVGAGISQASFNKLVVRVRDKVLESLLLDINLNRPGAYSDWYRHSLEARKKFMIAFTLLGRGQADTTFQLFERIQKIGHTYELYDELLEMTHWMINEKGLREGSESVRELKGKVKEYRNNREAIYFARSMYYEYFADYVDYKGQNNKKVGFLSKAIAQMQHDFKQTDASLAGFYLYLLLAEYYLTYNEFELACQSGEQLVKLIENRPAIYMPRRLGFAYSDLADNYMLGHQFKKAITTAEQAKEHKETGDFNYNIDLQTQVLCLLHTNQTKKAQAQCKQLVKYTEALQDEFRLMVRKYLLANIEFLLGNHQATNQLLVTLGVETPDREGWGFGIRLLTLQTQIERQQLDQAEAGIENLRKYITNSPEEVEFRKRDLVIEQVLRALYRTGFDFEKTYQQKAAQFTKLERADERYGWEVKTPEIIVFHEWFKSKMLNKPYNHAAAIKVVERAQARQQKKSLPKVFAG